MSERLTEKQAAVLLFIADHIAVRGMAPTVRYIGKAFGFRSTNAVSDYLRAFVRKGALRKVKPDEGNTTIARGIALTESGLAAVESMRGDEAKESA